MFNETLFQLSLMNTTAIHLVMFMFVAICVLVITNCALLIYCQSLDEENIVYRERDNQRILEGNKL
jgi:hypothetical protein